jgi:FlaA1/EpsC-like NDP-sugar epimerase
MPVLTKLLSKVQISLFSRKRGHPSRFSREGFFPLALWDAISVIVSFVLALAFRFDGRVSASYMRSFGSFIPLLIAVYCITNTLFGLYNRLWRYASMQEVFTIGFAAATGTILLVLASLLWPRERPVPISVVMVGGILAFGLFTTLRYRQRLLTGLMGYAQKVVGSPDRHRVLIVGAGEAGQLLAWQLKTYHRQRYEVVGFVDDDPRKLGLLVHGIPVLGNRSDIPRLVTERKADSIIIAIHRIPGPALREILHLCLMTSARVKILPDVLDHLADNSPLPLKEVGPQDFIGREICQVDMAGSRELMAGKVVLVTGAAGSIGAELCRQILQLEPQLLLALDNNESGLYELGLDLPVSPAIPSSPQRWKLIIADVTDSAKMESIFALYRPQIIFHAAAYKHVHLMEEYPEEAVRVNVMGTRIAAELAARYGAERFVLISTDKAVNPCSVMGATKRLCEMMIASMGGDIGAEEQKGQKTLFAAVRFGNVLGSRGSVVPTFERQIERGGPVTITHPEMTRYFMSVSEAVKLVIQAATLTQGSDIFLLEMGQQIRIEDLAHLLIRLRGLRPGMDIPIVYIGPRPGEKIHEELLADSEEREPTSNPYIFRVRCNNVPDHAVLQRQVDELITLAKEQRKEELALRLMDLVNSHRSSVS